MEVLKISRKFKDKVRGLLSLEKGAVRKDPGGRISVCLVYPNTYTTGMANLGFQTAYHLFNSVDNCLCERAFLPDKEDEAELLRTGAPLFSFESLRPLKDFDIVAFSVPFEEDYPNILKILDLARMPLRSGERNNPLVMAGGVAPTLNPEPLSDFVDFYLAGEAEGAVEELVEALSGLRGKRKEEVLRHLDGLDFIYVPSFYEFLYDGVKVSGIRPGRGAKERVKAHRNLDIERTPIPRNFIFTPSTAFKDTFLMEIERGCPRGCRFCAAGFAYLPPRWRGVEPLKEALREGLETAGKAGLVGAAVSEYPGLKELLEYGVSLGADMTLSSLRLDCLDQDLVRLLKKGGLRTVTIAPEAGTERMRNAINKGISDEEITEAAELVSAEGFKKLKLYFLAGLPGETDADAEAIAALSLRIKKIMKGGGLTLSINPFIPKPVTPFQWHGFEDVATIDRRLSVIRKTLAGTGIEVMAMGGEEALPQAYISRGDRRTGDFLIRAKDTGFRRAVKAERAFIEASVYHQRTLEETLPWDTIDHGLNKSYLWKEYQRGLKGKTTPPCNVGVCTRCGVCAPAGGNFL